MPHPLDEYPVHQAPLSIRYADSSDRNFYDRYYFNAHDRTGELFFITGFGVYPNLGVTDAYATFGGATNSGLSGSRARIDDDRMTRASGDYRIEVIEPLQKVRLICDGDEHGMGFDITWEGSFPAVEEQHHVMRTGDRVILDACRFAQVGTWEGVIRVGGDELTVDSPRWVGTATGRGAFARSVRPSRRVATPTSRSTASTGSTFRCASRTSPS